MEGDGNFLMRLPDHMVMDMGKNWFLSSVGTFFDEEDEW